jgi:hypothetical protein
MKHYVYNEVIRFEDLKKIVNSEEFNKKNKNARNFRDFCPAGGYFDKGYFGFNRKEELKAIEDRQISFNNGDTVNSNKYELINSYSGSLVNMDAYLSGEPEDMYNFVDSNSNVVKDLKLFISMNGGVEAKKIEEAAKKVLKYIEDKPANVFFNISLVSSGTYTTGNKHSRLEVILSDSDSYITNEVINLLCSPAMYRYYILKYCIIEESRKPDQTPKDCINFMNFDLTTY